jgi:formylglycine-generating enzyme required for sulfatase activity
MAFIYNSGTEFVETGYHTDKYVAGRRVKVDCGADGIHYTHVVGATYDGADTTVTVFDSVVTSNLAGVQVGVISAGSKGTQPLHTHESDEQGGALQSASISDFDTAVKSAETVTALSLTTNILTYVDENGTSHEIDLSLYLDDTNLARLTSGTLDGSTGIATFTRDDASTFTVDFSALLDDTQVTVEDNLTSTSADNALSANQGRVLNNQHIALRESVAELDINPIIYDDFGDANCMVRIPKFRLEDIDASLGTGVHPAFVVNGVEKDAIYYGQYPASVKGSNYVSVPNADPATGIDHLEALLACTAKGAGWHLSTNAEWAALALWAWKNGTLPHGNNNYGRDVDYKHETARLTQSDAVLGSSGTARTATGTGPATWAHDHTMHGVHDMNGNVWEWQGGLRINDGEIQILADNNAADSTKDQSATSSEWKAILQDGSLVTPGTADTLKYDATGVNGGGSPILNTTVTSQSTGSEYSYAYFESLSAETGVSVPALMIALGMYPVGTGLGGDRIDVSNVGERLPFRGGCWSSSTYAGVFYLYLANGRTALGSVIGFRPAFVI